MSSQPRRGGGGGGGHQSRGNNRQRGGGGGRSSRGNGGRYNRGNNRRPGRGGERSAGHDDGGGNTLGRDEDVLIAFMPYLKGDNAEATRIHEDYQSSNDQRAFLRAAREFLARESQSTTSLRQNHQQQPMPVHHRPVQQQPAPQPPVQHHQQLLPPAAVLPPPTTTTMTTTKRIDPSSLFTSTATGTTSMTASSNLFPPIQPSPAPSVASPSHHHNHPVAPPPTTALPQDMQQPHLSADEGEPLNMASIQNGINAILQEPGDPIINLPSASASIWGQSPAPSETGPPPPITPPRPVNGSSAPPSQQSSPWAMNHHHAPPQPTPPGLIAVPKQQPLPPGLNITSSATNSPLPPPTFPSDLLPPSAISLLPKPAAAAASVSSEASPIPPPKPQPPVKKEPPPPKRLWMHFDEQPGRILVDGCAGEDSSLVLSLAPRQELSAHWSLPLDYLRRCRPRKNQLEEALSGLTVGLFRRGCTENGAQASIISKRVLGDDNRSYDFGVDPGTNSVRGRVPFYSPRTPGHVIFRLYWDHEPVYTLAMGPTLHVRVTERDFDSSIRFILSNFKGKKSNPTSLSSLHSLAQVLETPLNVPNESAARAVWGCIQEARKVVEACAQEYVKTTNKLSQLEDSVDELRKQVEEEDVRSQTLSIESGDDERVLSEAALMLREKTRSLMSGRASSERKWRDSQLAFASILRAAVTNPSMNMLLRRDLIARMRIEFELWCPLSEEFAVAGDKAKIWYEALRELPQAISTDHFALFAQARCKMQLRTLGFEPNTTPLDDILFPRTRQNPNQRTMDPGAVTIFNVMSTAMGQYFQELYAEEDAVLRQREVIRERTEKCVQECGVFPPGTRVVIFGSSANGFGSPKSDIDMCLQLPPGQHPHLSDEDSTGSEAMAKLAEFFERFGMQNVDTSRLTARIPVIKYDCPNPLSNGEDDDDSGRIECDLSMHNPLAVLNTSLLHTYADITPVTRVLASIIKRWAKARDINNPARHTLSSYGYIIMLLHFLTYHKRAGNGLMIPVAPTDGNPRYRKQPGQPDPPLLPNLQWMDPMWPNFPRGTPYCEITQPPKHYLNHPMEREKRVNSYFYRPNTPNDRAALQHLFPGQDLSLAILLATFFRYYAYEFDYKKHVVSLHSTAARGVVEREVKAELDGWRNYSAALTIEDPFETFYDVAHVLRGGYYHRIRREFAVAYSKIADAAAGRSSSYNKGDLRAMSGRQLIDWICEPVANEREQQQSVGAS